MNSLGSDREVVENKLILLYLIDGIKAPVSNLQITKLILENKFMNYFLQQQFLNELLDGQFLQTESSDEKVMYKITQAGKQSLGYFSGLIPSGIKGRIDSSISAIRKKIKNETLITADYITESENKFVVNCRVGEDNFNLMEINVTVGTRNDARTICSNWKRHTQDIYAEIINVLTKQRE
ncbi:MAG: DUF4364 family protein [Ruminiclostridium sp.]|nr:DUF4364 family protein [Ruminiclostridium sp.]